MPDEKIKINYKMMVNFCNYQIYISSFLFTDAHRALELLEDYHLRLSQPQDTQLKVAIEKVIRIFKSRLFQALLGKIEILQCCYCPTCTYTIFFSNLNILLLRPPLKICSFPAPGLPFHLWVGRQGDFFFQNRHHIRQHVQMLRSFTNLVPSKSSNGFCSFKSVNQFRT